MVCGQVSIMASFCPPPLNGQIMFFQFILHFDEIRVLALPLKFSISIATGFGVTERAWVSIFVCIAFKMIVLRTTYPNAFLF